MRSSATPASTRAAPSVATSIQNGDPMVRGFATHRVDDAQDGASVYVRDSAARRESRRVSSERTWDDQLSPAYSPAHSPIDTFHLETL